MSLNNFSATGRCTRDAELKHVGANGTPLAVFQVAVDVAGYKDGKYTTEPMFVKVELWGKRGETIFEWFTKGSRIAFAGPIRLETWKDRDGVERTSLACKASDVATIDTKAEREARGGGRTSADDLGDSGSYSRPSVDDNDDIPF